MNVVVRARSATEQTTFVVREAVKRVDRAQPVYSLDSLNRYFVDLSGGVGVIANLIGVFALLSLTLSVIGVYAVMHYSVTQRTSEIGIRLALGASRFNVRSMVLRHGMKLSSIGLGAALPAAIALGRVMKSTLAGIAGLDLSVLAVVTALVAAAALLALCSGASRRCRRPAHRDPHTVAIRS